MAHRRIETARRQGKRPASFADVVGVDSLGSLAALDPGTGQECGAAPLRQEFPAGSAEAR